jgi:predicted transposase/invertase (TIGR01784 family)
MNFSDEEQESYEGQLKWLRMEASTLKKCEAKGFAEGEIKGQRDALLLVATKMFSKGSGIQDIALITGLTQEEIEKHLKELACLGLVKR